MEYKKKLVSANHNIFLRFQNNVIMKCTKAVKRQNNGIFCMEAIVKWLKERI